MILPDVYKMETILLAFDCKDEFYYFIKDEFYYRRILLKKRFIISDYFRPNPAGWRVLL